MVATGQHGLLNAAGHAQLAANTFALHIHCLQLAGATGKSQHDQTEDGQTRQHEYTDVEAHHAQLGVDLTVVTHDADLPVGLALEIGKEHIALIAAGSIAEGGHPTAAALAEGLCDGAVVDDADDLLHGLPTDGLVTGTGDQLARMGQQEVERRGIEVSVVQRVAQDGDGNVEHKDGGRLLTGVEEGNDIAHHRDAKQAVAIRIGPEGRSGGYALSIASPTGVVVMGTGQLARPDLAKKAIGVGLKQTALRRIIVGDKAETATKESRMSAKHPLHGTKQGVGTRHVALHIPDMAAQRGLRQIEGRLHDDGLRRELRLGTKLQLVGQQAARVIILHGRYQLQQHGCSYDDDQTGVGLQLHRVARVGIDDLLITLAKIQLIMYYK